MLRTSAVRTLAIPLMLPLASDAGHRHAQTMIDAPIVLNISGAATLQVIQSLSLNTTIEEVDTIALARAEADRVVAHLLRSVPDDIDSKSEALLNLIDASLDSLERRFRGITK